MSADRVSMQHPETKARITAPATAVKVYEASGWTVVEDKTAETPEPPAPAGNRRTAKEETK